MHNFNMRTFFKGAIEGRDIHVSGRTDINLEQIDNRQLERRPPSFQNLCLDDVAAAHI